MMRPIVKVNFLDLRGCGLSILERLCLEEFLYQATDIQTNWFIIGYHEATQHRYFLNPRHQEFTNNNHNNTFLKPIQYINNDHDNNNDGHDIIKQMDGDNRTNDNVAIILGFGGKPKELLNIPLIQQDSVTCIKRFTGGGTVVLDTNSIWTTIIGRPNSFYSLNDNNNTDNIDTAAGSNNTTDKQSNDRTFLPYYPRNIMDWTAKTIFQPMFQLLESKHEEKQQIHKTQNNTNNQQQNHQQQQQKTMIMDTKSCSANDNSGRVITIPFRDDNKNSINNKNKMIVNNNRPNFVLQENDYVFMFPNNNNDDDDVDNNNNNDNMISKKIGGNAQSIGKNGFLHHTSFLWDYDISNMENYLLIPKKRPEYRSNRSHEHFITSIKSIYPHITPTLFCKTFYDICYKQFHNNQISNNDNNDYRSITSDNGTNENNLLSYEFQTCTIQDVMSLVREHSKINNWNATGSNGLQEWYEHKSRNKVLTDIDLQ